MPDTTVAIFEGLRSFERQGELYAQGRTAPGKIATNAISGMSWHQYGLAVDIVFDGDETRPGPQWTWDGKMPWPTLGEYSDGFGLEWAGNWVTFKEYPHFQMTFGLQLVEAHALFQQGGIQAVWKAIPNPS